MFTIDLPVVAHRVFGLQHSVGTAWSSAATASNWDNSFLMAMDQLAASGTEDEPDQAPAPLELATLVSPGTRRTIDEIRDFFDGEGRAASTGDDSVNAVWEQADIRFKLTAIVDHAIRSDHAVLMGDPHQYARRLTHPGVVNVYFVRAIDGAAGFGFATPWPRDARKQPSCVFVSDWEDVGTDWAEAVWTLSHELGHLLSLSHEASPDNLMWTWIGSSGLTLRPVQVMVARDYARRYLPGVRDLCVTSSLFSRLYSTESSEPRVSRAYAGDAWRFDELRETRDSLDVR
jgi:hypothetical protein